MLLLPGGETEARWGQRRGHGVSEAAEQPACPLPVPCLSPAPPAEQAGLSGSANGNECP